MKVQPPSPELKAGLQKIGEQLTQDWLKKAGANGQAIVDAYKKEFGHEPVYHSAAGYAGCMIYAEAVKRAGTLDANKVRETLLKLEMKTAFGDYKVDETGFQVAHKMVILQWQEGKKHIVWPDELAAMKARFPTPPWNAR